LLMDIHTVPLGTAGTADMVVIQVIQEDIQASSVEDGATAMRMEEVALEALAMEALAMGMEPMGTQDILTAIRATEPMVMVMFHMESITQVPK